MSALRNAIRHKLATVLTGAVDLVGERVHVNRIVPWVHAELPAIGIYSTGEETAEDYDSLHLRRRARMVVEVVVDSAAGGVDDQCDAIAEQVEQTLFACPYLDGVVGHMTLTDIEGPNIAPDGERIAAILRINWLAEYLQPIPAATVTPDQAMHEVHVTMDVVDGSNDTPEAVDVIDTAPDA